MNLQGEKHVFFMGKTQLVPAGYVVNKNGLGGVGVGPQQNRNSQLKNKARISTDSFLEKGKGQNISMIL